MSALARFKSLRRRIQRRRYRAPVLLGDESGEIDVGLGTVWVRFEAGTDENGNTTFAPATVVNAGSANYAVYAGARLWVGYDENDELTILNPDNRDLRNAEIASQILNSARPENAFVYLRNVWRLLSRPTGAPIEPATTVYVNPLVYDDNYGDFNVYTGTPKAANKVDLSSFIPSTGNHRIAVLFLDTVTDTIQTVASTTQSMSADIDATDYQECFDQRNAETIPIQAYLLQNDASSIDAHDLTEDLRQFVNMPVVLGFPNPVDKDQILRSGRTELIAGDLTVTADFTVLGDLTFMPTDTRITSEGGTFGDHIDGDYSAFEDDGTLRFEGDARVWDDMRIPGLAVAAGASAPDLISFLASGGLKTYGFNGTAITEEVHFTVQLPHSYVQGTDIEPHVHWSPVNTNAGDVVWQLEYTWANINGTFPASTTITATDSASGTAWDHQVVSFSAITGTGKNISSMLVCRLFRDPTDGNDTYASDAAFLEFDFHFQIDTVGSREEFTK